METWNYLDWVESCGGPDLRLAEDLPFDSGRDWTQLTELELQAAWFSGDFGTHFVGTAGERVEIVQFGAWNRESGPDFVNAVVRVNEQVFKGCIELDRDAVDWERHGHACNPAFEDVVLHLFFSRGTREFFVRSPSNRQIPQVDLSAQAPWRDLARSSAPSHAGRCVAAIRALDEKARLRLLEKAAWHRLHRKGERLLRLMQIRGVEEGLYQEFAAALGYKKNAVPMRLLAQRLTLAELRAREPTAREALLFGMAGFLPKQDLRGLPEESRVRVRSLWDLWWPCAGAWRDRVLPADAWKLTGSRPLNHPQRRLAALAEVVGKWSDFQLALDKFSVDGVENFLADVTHPFWEHHYTLKSKRSEKAMACIGESRVQDLFANLVYPLWIARGSPVFDSYLQRRALLGNRKLVVASCRVFGTETAPKGVLTTVARQQGLMQIYDDFCLQDDTNCAGCIFPERVGIPG